MMKNPDLTDYISRNWIQVIHVFVTKILFFAALLLQVYLASKSTNLIFSTILYYSKIEVNRPMTLWLAWESLRWQPTILIKRDVSASDDEYESQSCDSLIHEQCNDEEGYPVGVLSTEKDLEEYCKHTTKYFGCIERILDHCEKNEEESIINFVYLQDVITNNKRICDEDSLLYSALDESLPCLKQNKDKLYLCPGLNEENIESFKDALASVGITEFAAPNFEPQLCLDFVYGFGCFATNIAKACNDVAKDVAIDIMKGFDMPFEACHPGMRKNLHVIANVMQLEMEKEEAVEEKIKKKK